MNYYRAFLLLLAIPLAAALYGVYEMYAWSACLAVWVWQAARSGGG